MQKIPKADVIQMMHEENQWWQNGQLPERFASVRPRFALEQIFSLVTQKQLRRAVVLLGPRRVGKSFLIHHIIAKLLQKRIKRTRMVCLQLDNPVYNGLRLDELLELYQEATGIDWRTEKCYVFFDEIQYHKNWEQHLKVLVDRGTQAKFTVSGSAAAALRMKSQESGAGRFTDVLLPPLTFHEYLGLRGQDDLIAEDHEGTYAPDIDALNRSFIHYLNFGGYPEVALSDAAQDTAARYMRMDIIDKVLLRDLPSLYGISDIQELNSLFTALAYNTGDEVAISEMSKQSQVAKETLKRYLTYLEAAFLIRLISRVDHSVKRFQREHAYKVYLTNPSLRSGLFAPLKDRHEMMGNFVETGLFAQLFDQNPRNLHYARWKDGEVDQVMLDPMLKPLWATEVKWSDRPAKSPALIQKHVGFCKKNRLSKLLVTSKTQSRHLQIDGVDVTFEPAALLAHRLGKESLEAGNLIKESRLSLIEKA